MDDQDLVLSKCHLFLESISGVKKIVMNLGSFVMDKVALVDVPDAKRLVKAVSNLCLMCCKI